MKKLLIVCHKNSENYFKEIAYSKYPKLSDGAIAVITSKKEFNKLSLKSRKPDTIWILVELCWSQLQIKQGYNIALELMQKSELENNVLNISFFSILDRKTLLESTNDERHIFPKAFNHYHLPIANSDKIETLKQNRNSYNFIRNYALSKSHLISDITHRLETVLLSDHIPQKMVSVLDRLRAIKSILPQGIIDLLEVEYNSKSEVTTLLYKLIALKESYNPYEKIEENQETRLLRTIIILEDVKVVGVRIKNWLKPYCDDVIHCTGGKEVIKEIERHSSTLDLFFCDLELLDDDGFWQKIQGVEVLEYVKQKFPHVYTVVLSGLPTQAVKILIPERSYVNQHIRKKELGTEYSMKHSLFTTLKNAKKFSKRFTKGFTGPNVGKLKLIRERYFGLKFSTDKFDQSIIEEIHHKADLLYNSYKSNELILNELWSTELPSPKTTEIDDIWDYLPKILGLRKMILSEITLPTNSVKKIKGIKAYYFDYEAFKERKALMNMVKGIRAFMTIVSFNKEDQDETENTCYITLDNLFDSEQVFLDSLNKIDENTPVLECYALSSLEKFMDAINKFLGDDYFDDHISIQEFGKKLMNLPDEIPEHNSILQRFETILDSYFPFYDKTDIPNINDGLSKSILSFLNSTIYKNL